MGKSMQLKLPSPATTVLDVKIILQRTAGVDINNQRLVFVDRELADDSRTMEDLDIRCGSNLHLVVHLQAAADGTGPGHVGPFKVLAGMITELVGMFDCDREPFPELLKYSLGIINQRITYDHVEDGRELRAWTIDELRTWTKDELKTELEKRATQVEMEIMQSVLAEALVLAGVLPANSGLGQTPYQRRARRRVVQPAAPLSPHHGDLPSGSSTGYVRHILPPFVLQEPSVFTSLN